MENISPYVLFGFLFLLNMVYFVIQEKRYKDLKEKIERIQYLSQQQEKRNKDTKEKLEQMYYLLQQMDQDVSLRGNLQMSSTLVTQDYNNMIPNFVENEEIIIDLIVQGKKIEAIKRVREIHHIGLKEAKDYVDDLERKRLNR